MIKIKKMEISEQQITAHWSLILTKIKPKIREKEQNGHLLKKDDW